MYKCCTFRSTVRRNIRRFHRFSQILKNVDMDVNVDVDEFGLDFHHRATEKEEV